MTSGTSQSCLVISVPLSFARAISQSVFAFACRRIAPVLSRAIVSFVKTVQAQADAGTIADDVLPSGLATFCAAAFAVRYDSRQDADMSENSNSTASVSFSDSDAEQSVEPAPKQRTRHRSKSVEPARVWGLAWMTKPWFVALVVVVVFLSAGWGAYSVVKQTSPTTDESELADLEDFDLDAPSLGAGEPTEDVATSSVSLESQTPQLPSPSLGEAAPQLPPVRGFEFPSGNSLPGFESARYERNPNSRDTTSGVSSSSGAWLSGTIESVEDSPATIALPPRVSQAFGDDSTVR
jgi:hypothetical protein